MENFILHPQILDGLATKVLYVYSAHCQVTEQHRSTHPRFISTLA